MGRRPLTARFLKCFSAMRKGVCEASGGTAITAGGHYTLVRFLDEDVSLSAAAFRGSGSVAIPNGGQDDGQHDETEPNNDRTHVCQDTEEETCMNTKRSSDLDLQGEKTSQMVSTSVAARNDAVSPPSARPSTP